MEDGKLSKTKTSPLTGISVLIGEKRLNLKIVSKRAAEETEHKIELVKKACNVGVSKKSSAKFSSKSSKPAKNKVRLKKIPSTTSSVTARSCEREEICTFCGCCFASVFELAEHEPLCAAGETESENLLCFCKRTFATCEVLDNHLKTHESECGFSGESYSCRFCGSSWTTALTLNTHETIHVVKPFRCSFCNRAFLKKMELLMHETIHNGETLFACSYCGIRFDTKLKLMKHESQHADKSSFTCSYCRKTFMFYETLLKHERKHTGEKSFECPICTKRLSGQSTYDVHLQLHASGRRFFCTFCGRWFRVEHEMLDHQQNCLQQINELLDRHGKPFRYQCDFCYKMFLYRRDKITHERKHNGERPYTCGYCNRTFSQSQALTVHIRTHTGERPYACSVCSVEFIDSSALRRHEFVKHPTYQGDNQQAAGSNDGAEFEQEF